MPRIILVSLVIVNGLFTLASADFMHEALQDKYTAECLQLADCEAVLRYGEAFECSEGKCKCHPDATLDEKNKECVCNEGFVKLGNKCLVAVLVGDDCEYNEQCQKKLGSRSSCINFRCACDQGNIPTPNRSSCMLLKGLLEPCTYEEQCATNHSSCITGVCMCLPSYVNDESRACLKIVHGYEDNCSIPQQCHMGNLGAGSHCAKTAADEGRCTCLSSYHYNKNKRKCLSTVGHGEQCDDINTGCYLPLDGDNQNIECKKNKCQCKKKYYISEDKQRCNSALILQSSIFLILVSAVLSRRW